MNLKKGVSAVTDALKTSNIVPSEPNNTHVELASQAEPEKRKDEGGELPKSNALVSDRARVLKEIAERRNAQADAEANEETPPDPEMVGKDIEQDEETTKDEPVDAVPEVKIEAAPVPEELKTIIVDGQPMQVPVSKIVEMGIRTLQKEVAADIRLNQASKLLSDAQKLAQAPQPSKDVVEEMNDDQLAELIQFGTKEQAAKAVSMLRKQQQQFNPEDFLKVVQQAVPHQISFHAGKQFAESEYGDILKDPDLGTIFLNRENAARAAGDKRDYIELYKAIGDDLRTKFNRPKPGIATTSTVTMQDKQERKAAAPAAPKLASARIDGEGQAPRPPTREEVIDKLRAARGFNRLN
jgi:hypothetical protein